MDRTPRPAHATMAAAIKRISRHTPAPVAAFIRRRNVAPPAEGGEHGGPEASDRPGEGDGPGDHQIEADHIDRVGHSGVLQPPFEQEHQRRRTQDDRQAEERQRRTEQAEQPAQTFPLHQRGPQPIALGGVRGVALIEFFKNMRSHLRRNAASGVGDRYHGPNALFLQVHPDMSAWAGKLDGIGDEVVPHQAQELPVGCDGYRLIQRGLDLKPLPLPGGLKIQQTLAEFVRSQRSGWG